MKKVFVGLSGGVDSSVAALLLKQQGFNVIGVFIKAWQPDWIPCTWKIDRISALKVASHLDIPFVTLDLEKEYKDNVVNYLLSEYRKGNTPNPDMLCNREIKFGSFLEWALKNGADYVATGHYAKRVGDSLYEAADKEKDQSYFLSQITGDEIKHILFPLGELQKSEVRKIAEKNNLPTKYRPDSQGICFVGELSMDEFLRKELNPQPGNVLNENELVIGKHDGALLYTIGERISFKRVENTDSNEQMFVIRKDIDKNELIVGNKITVEVYEKDVLLVEDISLTNNVDLLKVKDLLIRIRYRGEKIDCHVQSYSKETKLISIKLNKAENFAKGQFAVFYQGEKCLGGGVIK